MPAIPDLDTILKEKGTPIWDDQRCRYTTSRGFCYDGVVHLRMEDEDGAQMPFVLYDDPGGKKGTRYKMKKEKT